MAMGSLSPIIRWTVMDGGAVAPGAKLYTYLSGTNTPTPVYNNADLDPSHAHANPVVADAEGTFPVIYLADISYRFLVTTSAGVTIFPAQDDVYDFAQLNQSTGVNVEGTAGQDLVAEDCVYLDSSAVWRKGDSDASASSIESQMGFVVNDIDSGETGLIRLSGSFSYTRAALTPGSAYYVSATAGDITATAPNINARLVGVADSATSLVIDPNPPFKNASLQSPRITSAIVGTLNLQNQGRLSLLTGVPVPPSDVTAATAVFWMPYNGGSAISTYANGAWTTLNGSQITIALPSTTSSIYDVFVYNNSGTLTLELSSAWISDTARFGSGPYASALPTQDNVYVKSTNGTAIDNTRRYLGTVRTGSVSGQATDSLAIRGIWNYYNRVSRVLQRQETTANWNYTTATIRQANGAAANQVDIVVGVQEVPIDLLLSVLCTNTNAGNVSVTVGFGEDVTNAISTSSTGGAGFVQAASLFTTLTAKLIKSPAIGRHFYSWNEYSAATGTTTWYGNGASIGGSGTQSAASGIVGTIIG